MPGFDGTGPTGRGPMTGRVNGYCILKKSGTGGRSLIGFAGLSGRPIMSGFPDPVLHRLQIRMRMEGLQWRIRMLKQSVVKENQRGT